jgi:hypothetical protein
LTYSLQRVKITVARFGFMNSGTHLSEIEGPPASNQSRGVQMIASEEQLERYRLTGRIVELLQRMSGKPGGFGKRP